jgi:hypothetical protein
MPDPNQIGSLQRLAYAQPQPTNPVSKFLADYNSDVIDRTQPQSLGSKLGETIFDLRNSLGQYHLPQGGLLNELKRQLQGNQVIAPINPGLQDAFPVRRGR